VSHADRETLSLVLDEAYKRDEHGFRTRHKAPPPTRHPTCTHPGCRTKHHARGYCSTHYHQFVRPPKAAPGTRPRRLSGRMDHNVVSAIASGASFAPDEISRQEAMCAAYVLTLRGWTARQIAEHLHVSPRTVVRYRRAWRQALLEDRFAPARP
jgi:hypothetical protein